MDEKISIQKKNAIVRHRKNKNLCIKCGKDPHDGDCEENYIKADTRDIQVKEKIVSDKSIETIISYRKRKNLCVKCGKNPHAGDCQEDYSKTDNRSKEEIQERPAVISTKSEPQPTILEKITNNDIVTLVPSRKIILLRPFIIIDLAPSRLDKIIEWNAIKQISKKYQNCITFIYGNVFKQYSYSDYSNLKKTPNIQMLSLPSEQEYINYIASSNALFGYPSKYLNYSMSLKIDTAIFDEKYSITSFLRNINYVNGTKGFRYE